MKYLIWADRIALVWWAFLILVVYLLWADPHSSPFSDPNMWRLWGLFAGIPWLILRGLDLIVTGQIQLVGCRAAMELAARRQPRRDRVATLPHLGPPLAPPGSGSTARERSDWLRQAQLRREASSPLHQLPPP